MSLVATLPCEIVHLDDLEPFWLIVAGGPVFDLFDATLHDLCQRPADNRLDWSFLNL